MLKFKFYIENAFLSGLIGLAVYVTALFIYGWRYFSFSELCFSVMAGVVIGSVSWLFCFHIFLRLAQRPLLGFVANFLVVALLNMAGAVMMGLRSYQLFIHYFFRSTWFVALIVSEILSFFLIFLWLQRITLYKQKLETKKMILKNRDQ
ncbi:MAG TPA: hypothetical protein DDW65_12755 [Firmicutes bacterium]|jgi:hypothetical protein|nr:hypothetical protein [Bacillota bacterium]